MRKLVTLTFAFFALIFATSAFADVGLRGPFKRGQPAIGFTPMYGGGHHAAASVDEARRAGALPPSRKTYLEAVEIINRECMKGQKFCGTSQAVLDWINEGGTRQIPLKAGYYPVPQQGFVEAPPPPRYQDRVAKKRTFKKARVARHYNPRPAGHYAPPPAQTAYGQPCSRGPRIIVYCN